MFFNYRPGYGGMLCDEGKQKKQIKMDLFAQFHNNTIWWFSELKFCEENPKACLNDGKCTSVSIDEGSFKCECPSGFKGKKCEIVPVIANSTISSSSPRPIISTSTKLPNQEPTVLSSEEDDSEHDSELTTAESPIGGSDVVEEPSVEEIDNEA